MLKGFRDFIMRGNVVDLAVAVVIGAAFALVIKAFTEGIVTPLIAAVFGEPNLDSVGTFTINGAQFSIGVVLTALILFVITAAVIYFFVVAPMNKLKEMQARKEGDQAGDEESELDVLKQIRDQLHNTQG